MFVTWERRTVTPMFDLTLLTRPAYLGLSLSAVVFVVAFVPLLVLLPVFQQVGRGVGTAAAGALILFATAPTVVMPSLTRMLARRFTTRVIVVAGLTVAALGLLGLSRMTAGGPVLAVGIPLLVIGIGVGVSFAVLDGAAVSSVPLPEAGVAAGMFNTLRLSGETAAIAAAGSLLTALTASDLGRPDLADAVTAGDRSAIAPGDLDAAVDALTRSWHVLVVVIAVFVLVSLPLLAHLLKTAPSTVRPRGERPVGDTGAVEQGSDRGPRGDRSDEVSGAAVAAADGDATGVGAFDDPADRPAVCGVAH